jgi:hypothetical protein
MTAREAKFWGRVQKGEGCWEWTGSLFPTGYGQLPWGGRAHRYSVELEIGGPLPRGEFVLHSCDNRKCVRPDHLRLGSQSENLQEAHDKGRMVDNRGENSGKAVLTNEQAREIRERYAAKQGSQRELALEYGLTRGVIRNVVSGRCYHDAGGPIVEDPRAMNKGGRKKAA